MADASPRDAKLANEAELAGWDIHAISPRRPYRRAALDEA